jgi:FG-GAP-like repeat
VGPIFGLNIVQVGDTNKDGLAEVITGSGQWGSVTGYRGSDGAELWSIANPEHGVFGIGVGDVDADGENEVLWGAGLSSTGRDALFIGDWNTQTVEWGSSDLDAPLRVAVGDINNDGRQEIVMASFSTDSGYAGGTLTVYDALTHQNEWSVLTDNSYYDIYQVAVGKLDSGAGLDIVVGGDNLYDTRLEVYDGVTHNLDWKSPVLLDMGGAPRALLVQNLNGSAVDDIIVGLSNKHIQVFEGATPVILWDSGALDGNITDIGYGDADGDSKPELVILTDQSIYEFDPVTFAMKAHQSLVGGQQVGIVEGKKGQAGKLVIAIRNGDDSETLKVLAGSDFHTLWQTLLGQVTVSDIAVGDLDGGGTPDLVVAGYGWNEGGGRYPSLLLIGSVRGSQKPIVYRDKGYWGWIRNLVLADLNGDGKQEVVFGSDSLIQVDALTGILK